MAGVSEQLLSLLLAPYPTLRERKECNSIQDNGSLDPVFDVWNRREYETLKMNFERFGMVIAGYEICIAMKAYIQMTVSPKYIHEVSMSELTE